MRDYGFAGFALRYATRSIWRNKRRTLLTIGTVTLSVAVSIIATRYSKAVLQIWQDGAINNGAGHAQFHVKGYSDHPDVLKKELNLTKGQPIEQRLVHNPEVQAFSRRLLFEGIISAGSKTIYFLGRAIDPDAELKVCPEIFHQGVDQGTFMANGRENAIAVGRGLADTLGLKVGDEATLMTQTLAGGVNGIDVVVAGIVDPPLPSLSKRLIYMRLPEGERALRLGDSYSELAVRLKDGTKAESWVQSMLPVAQKLGLDLKGWWDIDPLIRNVQKIWDSVVGVISFLLFISAGISVLNIVFMLVAERTVEIGTLMAIGARARDIRTLFTLEASLIGLLGGACGAVAGNFVILLMDLIGVPFQSPFGSGILEVHPKISVLSTLVVAFLAVVICYISALAPSRKAALVEPVTAFRGQIT